LAATHRGFAFYVASPKSSIRPERSFRFFAARTIANRKPSKSTPRRSFGPKFFSPVGAQEFHLRFESAHAQGDAFIFFRGPGDRSIDRALTDQALKLFINAQAQHLFPAAGSVSFPKVEQDDVEQRLEFK